MVRFPFCQCPDAIVFATPNVGVHLLAEAGEARCSQSGAKTGYAEPSPKAQPVKWRNLAQGESLRARSEWRQHGTEARYSMRGQDAKTMASIDRFEGESTRRRHRMQRHERARRCVASQLLPGRCARENRYHARRSTEL